MKFSVYIESLSLLMRDNDVIDALKNLHQHVEHFKGALNKQEDLQIKVLAHIRSNFVRLLASDSVSAAQKFHSNDKNTPSILYGNYERNTKLPGLRELDHQIDRDQCPCQAASLYYTEQD